MSDGIWSAASGAVAQVTAMDVAAENIANTSTPAYRADRAVFREVLARTSSRSSSASPSSFSLHYAAVSGTAPDTTPGTLEATGRSLDVALKGDGYLVVRTSAGERYTRFGGLTVSADGTLVTREGAKVVDSGRNAIRIPEGTREVSVASDGTVSADGASVGELQRVQFANPGALEKEGAYLLRVRPGSGATATRSDVAVESGALEGSNSVAVTGMLQIVNASRSYEICEKMIEAFRDADHKAAVDVMAQK